VEVAPVSHAHWQTELKREIENYAETTGSIHAKNILLDWAHSQQTFLQICPKEMLTRLEFPLREAA
jgi:glutamate synthase (NADPH/NADH) large chain